MCVRVLYLYLYTCSTYICIHRYTYETSASCAEQVGLVRTWFKFTFLIWSQYQWHWSKHVGRCTIISVASSNRRILYWHLWCHSWREWYSENFSRHSTVIQLLFLHFSWSTLEHNNAFHAIGDWVVSRQFPEYQGEHQQSMWGHVVRTQLTGALKHCSMQSYS